jgi:hypothetical protein
VRFRVSLAQFQITITVLRYIQYRNNFAFLCNHIQRSKVPATIREVVKFVKGKWSQDEGEDDASASLKKIRYMFR